MTDYKSLPNRELARELRLRLMNTPEAHEILTEFLFRLGEAEVRGKDVFVLPVAITDAIRRVCGGGKRAFEPVYKRCCFAWQSWDKKYGPMNAAQAEYAEELLLYGVNRCITADRPPAAAIREIERMVNHERVDEGFQSRAAKLEDISELLGQVLQPNLLGEPLRSAE